MKRSVKILAALVHDQGKTKTFHMGEDRDAHAFGHEAETFAAKTFMQKIGVPIPMRKQAMMLTKHHMRMKAVSQVSKRQVIRLIKELATVGLTIFDWAEFHQMDARGKHINPHSDAADLVLEIAEPILEGQRLPKPLVTGKDLIQTFKMQGGKHFGIILGILFEEQCLHDLSKQDLLNMVPSIMTKI